jgi:excisionase family DNA binding protein
VEAANDNAKQVLNADEVAELLRVNRKTVYEYAGRGAIPHRRLGARLLFSRAAVMRWLEACSGRSSNGVSA